MGGWGCGWSDVNPGISLQEVGAIIHLKVMLWAPVRLLIGCHTASLGGVRVGIEAAEAR